MENVQELIKDWAALGDSPPEEITINGQTLLKSSLETSKVVATLKRDKKSRKVQVLAYEEWSDGVWVKHQSIITNTNGKRKYNARVNYSRPEAVVSLEEIQ